MLEDVLELPKSLEECSVEEQRLLGNRVVQAMETIGFLLIRTPLVSLEFQKQALDASTNFLLRHNNTTTTSTTKIVTQHHPQDPKLYAMLSSNNINSEGVPLIIREYQQVMKDVKTQLLQLMDIGLEELTLEDNAALTPLHSQENNSLRLLYYPPGDERTGNRCKEHSDYGTLTLLVTDGVSGLEYYNDDGFWKPVPYIPGTIVVNIGTWTSLYTNHRLKATLHRVAGPASIATSHQTKEALQNAIQQGRSSIAFFADPNPTETLDSQSSQTVADYIQWRSGGSETDSKRSGVAYIPQEQNRIHE